VPGARAQTAQTDLPHPQRPRRPGARARLLNPRVTRQARDHPMNPRPAPHDRADPEGDRPRKNERPQPSAGTPNTTMSPAREPTRPSSKVSMGARAHSHRTPRRAHAPPTEPSDLHQPIHNPGGTSKRSSGAGSRTLRTEPKQRGCSVLTIATSPAEPHASSTYPHDWPGMR